VLSKRKRDEKANIAHYPQCAAAGRSYRESLLIIIHNGIRRPTPNSAKLNAFHRSVRTKRDHSRQTNADHDAQ
jgi:hypothetical protein